MRRKTRADDAQVSRRPLAPDDDARAAAVRVRGCPAQVLLRDGVQRGEGPPVVGPQRGQKDVAVQRPEHRRLGGGDGSSAQAVAPQRGLAEALTWTEVADRPSVHLDSEVAVLDEQPGRARFTLSRDDVAARQVEAAQPQGEPL